MAFGFVAALAGDWMLAVRGSPTGSSGFLAGVAFFACAHVFWTIGQLADSRPDLRVLVALGAPVVCFAAVRLVPVLSAATYAALVAYSVVSVVSLSVAFGGRRRFYILGISLLVVSDLAIGCRILRMPGAGLLVGPLYVLAEVMLFVSFLRRREARAVLLGSSGFGMAAFAGSAAALCFVLAMAVYPGQYNPCLRMLSALGRTSVRMVDWPWSHPLFTIGMLFSSVAVASVVRGLGLCAWGAAVNIAGLLWIAAVPENISMPLHNAGCWLAAGGGAAMLFSWRRTESSAAVRRTWTIALIAPISLMGAALVLHALKVVPFAPLVTTLQKLVILSFTMWLLFLSARGARRCALVAGGVFLSLPVVLAAVLFMRGAGPSVGDILAAAPESAAQVAPGPLSEDEMSALAWLEKVTGGLSPEEEREWWGIGGSQHGIFAKRYSIAFAGYAAAAIGMRGDADVKRRVGKVLGDCVRRILKTDVWAYSQSKNYWGRRSWAPDPCYRENVMYTGHLLHLLALYERFTGDVRYHRKGGGWDFVWKNGRKVHYDVEKLIDVTVEQMRKGPNGGVTCEPGLMFFPCNCHPHVAFALFRRMGYGDWTEDARRWERWALPHYFGPLLGGGALNLVYHVKGNFMYPRGQGALDGWSMLWYEAWASDRRLALALWERAREMIDWDWIASAGDECAGGDCCDPQPVSPAVASVFLAAAARACSDHATAERLERAVDGRFLRRDGGLFRLDLNREWRIGASAMRIISLAESHGSSFRRSLR